MSEKTTSSYQREFRQLGMRLGDRLNSGDWMQLYDELVKWELQLSGSEDQGMAEILRAQWNEASDLFSRFVAEHYVDWVNGRATTSRCRATCCSARRWPADRGRTARRCISC